MDSQYLVFTEKVSAELIAFCRRHKINTVVTVADSNIYSIVGSEINDGLSQAGVTAKAIILNGNGLTADAESIMSVMVDMDVAAQAMVSIGSGTITDITRFVSHRTGKEFISVPTAPSVDGYSSNETSLVLKGIKQTVRCHAPGMILATLSLLTAAPPQLIAAGFGEVLGKITALADWELARLFMGTAFDREIADANLTAYQSVVTNAQGIAKRDPEAIRALFGALSDTGDSIRRFGSSEPASGSEHTISRFIEMRRLFEKKPALLHGSTVALGAIVAAGWYKSLRNLTKEQVSHLPLKVPDFEEDAWELRRLLGEAGDLILESNSFLSTLSQQRVIAIRSVLLDNWETVQRVAAQVPEPEELKRLLRTVGGPESFADLGLSQTDVANAARLSHYVRSHFTISTLFFTIGLGLS